MHPTNKAMKREKTEKNTVPEKKEAASVQSLLMVVKIFLLLSMRSILFMFSLRIVWRFHFYESHEQQKKKNKKFSS